MPKRVNQSKSRAVPKKGKSISKQKQEAGSREEPHEPQMKVEKKVVDQTKNYSLNMVDGAWEVQLHSKYRVTPDNKLHPPMRKLYDLLIEKQKKKQHSVKHQIPYSHFPSFELELRGDEHKDDKCSICQFQYELHPNHEEELTTDSDSDIITFSCSHLMHIGCFEMLRNKQDWVRCPVCFTIYGVMTGDQPNGQMTWNVNQGMHCDGFPEVGTICINYAMNSTVRNGQHYQGTHRHAYLPDNPQGREVLSLLHEAFKRKLIFTLGRSVTTGRDNQVVWNGIHHKTNLEGGSAYFGFPDPTYFDRVKLELAMKGVK